MSRINRGKRGKAGGSWFRDEESVTGLVVNYRADWPTGCAEMVNREFAGLVGQQVGWQPQSGNVPLA